MIRRPKQGIALVILASFLLNSTASLGVIGSGPARMRSVPASSMITRLQEEALSSRALWMRRTPALSPRRWATRRMSILQHSLGHSSGLGVYQTLERIHLGFLISHIIKPCLEEWEALREVNAMMPVVDALRAIGGNEAVLQSLLPGGVLMRLLEARAAHFADLHQIAWVRDGDARTESLQPITPEQWQTIRDSALIRGRRSLENRMALSGNSPLRYFFNAVSWMRNVIDHARNNHHVRRRGGVYQMALEFPAQGETVMLWATDRAREDQDTFPRIFSAATPLAQSRLAVARAMLHQIVETTHSGIDKAHAKEVMSYLDQMEFYGFSEMPRGLDYYVVVVIYQNQALINTEWLDRLSSTPALQAQLLLRIGRGGLTMHLTRQHREVEPWLFEGTAGYAFLHSVLPESTEAYDVRLKEWVMYSGPGDLEHALRHLTLPDTWTLIRDWIAADLAGRKFPIIDQAGHLASVLISQQADPAISGTQEHAFARWIDTLYHYAEEENPAHLEGLIPGAFRVILPLLAVCTCYSYFTTGVVASSIEKIGGPAAARKLSETQVRDIFASKFFVAQIVTQLPFPEFPSTEHLIRYFEDFIQLLARSITAPTATWRKKSPPSQDDNENIPVPHLGDINIDVIAMAFRVFALLDKGMGDVYVLPMDHLERWGMGLAKGASASGLVTITTADHSIVAGSFHLPEGDLIYNDVGGGVEVIRYRRKWWHTLIGLLHADEENIPGYRFLACLARVRWTLTPRGAQAHRFFAPDGAFLDPWVESLLDKQAHITVDFLTLLRTVYPTNFSEMTGSVGPSILLAWYYSLLTIPGSLLNQLAERLMGARASSRLSAETACFLIDSLCALYWSKPLGHPMENVSWLFRRILDFIVIYPDGIGVRDLEGFIRFLIGDIGEHHLPFLDDIEAWARERFSEGVEVPDMRPSFSSPPLEAGQGVVIPSIQPSYFIPRAVPVEDVLHPERVTSIHAIPLEKSEQESSPAPMLVYRGIYHQGFRLPGTSWRLLLQGVSDGESLLLIVEGTRARVVPLKPGSPDLHQEPAWDDTHPYAQFSVEEALSSRCVLPTAGQTWERVPVFPAPASELPLGRLTAVAGFYRLIPSGDGLIQLASRNAPVFFDASHISSMPLVAELQGQDLNLFDAAGHLLGILDGQGRFSSAPQTFLEVLPPLSPPLLQAVPITTLADYRAIAPIDQALRPLLDRGFFHHVQIHLTPGNLFHLGWENDTLSISGEQLPSAEDLQRAWQAMDPIACLREVDEQLRTMISSSDIDVILASALPDMPAPLDGSQWHTQTREDYLRIQRSATAAMRMLETTRRIARDFQGVRGVNARRVGRAVLRALREDAKDINNRQRVPSGALSSPDGLRAGLIYEAGGWTIDAAGLQLKLGAHLDPTELSYIYVEWTPPALGPAGGKKTKSVIPRTNVRLYRANTGERYEPHLEAFERRMTDLIQRINPYLPPGAALTRDTLNTMLQPFSQPQREEIIRLLNDILPRICISPKEHPQSMEINAYFLRWVMADIINTQQRVDAEAAVREVVALAGLLQREPRYLWVHALALAAVLGENIDERWLREELPEFMRQVILPSIEVPKSELASEHGLSTQEYLSDLSIRLTDLWNRLESLRDISGGFDLSHPDDPQWDEVAATHLRLIAHAEQPPTALQRYLIRLLVQTETIREDEVPLTADEERMRLSRAELKLRATHVTVYGGGTHIGASCIETRYLDPRLDRLIRLLFDVGSDVGVIPRPPAIGLMDAPPQAVFLTHAHRDHIGMVLLFYKEMQRRFGVNVPFYATPGTIKFLPLVLRSFLRHRQESDAGEWGYAGEYEEVLSGLSDEDIDDFMTHVHPVKFGETVSVSPSVKVLVGRAGHLHGAAWFMIMTPDGNTLITGDISTHQQGMTKQAEFPNNIPVHTMVSESTSGMQPVPDLKEERSRILNMMIRTLQRGGKVLLPSNALVLLVPLVVGPLIFGGLLSAN